ncbi:hypothetical protein AJ80_06674 [Polytolypa hystricis UAMH7299]|uniref:Uncharacterized protein n=1 Tax=Polytolypa hystricis (strain UAMH7299) TaxID=1447883 RepID=A0A2B7XUJ5_POLH7|nr:hypothetical protein AJ80_06674 [Polytolypa hystricis UAMH7299]
MAITINKKARLHCTWRIRLNVDPSPTTSTINSSYCKKITCFKYSHYYERNDQQQNPGVVRSLAPAGERERPNLGDNLKLYANLPTHYLTSSSLKAPLIEKARREIEDIIRTHGLQGQIAFGMTHMHGPLPAPPYMLIKTGHMFELDMPSISGAEEGLRDPFTSSLRRRLGELYEELSKDVADREPRDAFSFFRLPQTEADTSAAIDQAKPDESSSSDSETEYGEIMKMTVEVPDS